MHPYLPKRSMVSGEGCWLAAGTGCGQRLTGRMHSACAAVLVCEAGKLPVHSAVTVHPRFAVAGLDTAPSWHSTVTAGCAAAYVCAHAPACLLLQCCIQDQGPEGRRPGGVHGARPGQLQVRGHRGGWHSKPFLMLRAPLRASPTPSKPSAAVVAVGGTGPACIAHQQWHSVNQINGLALQVHPQVC